MTTLNERATLCAGFSVQGHALDHVLMPVVIDLFQL